MLPIIEGRGGFVKYNSVRFPAEANERSLSQERYEAASEHHVDALETEIIRDLQAQISTRQFNEDERNQIRGRAEELAYEHPSVAMEWAWLELLSFRMLTEDELNSYRRMWQSMARKNLRRMENTFAELDESASAEGEESKSATMEESKSDQEEDVGLVPLVEPGFQENIEQERSSDEDVLIEMQTQGNDGGGGVRAPAAEHPRAEDRPFRCCNIL
jgi:hypothetical protein